MKMEEYETYEFLLRNNILTVLMTSVDKLLFPAVYMRYRADAAFLK